MGFINLQEKTINAKLVYYGVGLGGKTTSLKAVHRILCPRDEVKLVSINTEQDATLLFDFLPIDLGSIGGFKIRVQGFTVPGQPKYVVMRKYVLSGADAVVFVVDSKADRVDENLQAIRDLKKNLKANGLDWRTIPLVIQYNKRDLEDALPSSELADKFLFREVPAFESVATRGEGVLEAFGRATGLMVEEKVRQYGLAPENVEPAAVAREAEQRILEAGQGTGPIVVDEDAVHEQGLVDVVVDPEASERLGQEPVPPAPSGVWKAGTIRVEDTIQVEGETSSGDGTGFLAAGVAEIKVEEPERERGAEDGGERSPAATSDSRDPAKRGSEAGGAADRRDGGAPDSARDRDPGDRPPPGPADEEDVTDPPAGEVEAPDPPLGEEEAVGLLGQAITSNMEMAGLYAELAEYKSLLERKNRELVEVNQLISHDLKKPLTVFKTVVRLMLGGQLGELADRQRDALQNAAESVQYMEELIEDIVESSRLDYDGVRLEFVEIDMTVLFGKLVRRLRYLLEEQEVRTYIEPLPVIRGDEKAMMKVFMNLIGNAIRYRDPQKRPCWVKVRAEEDGAFWVFEVEDNGIGIPEENLGRVWEKFTRGDNTTGVTGTGLGLYIVKELVVGHGGEVSVESRIGEGSTFRVRLPKEPKQAEHSPVH